MPVHDVGPTQKPSRDLFSLAPRWNTFLTARTLYDQEFQRNFITEYLDPSIIYLRLEVFTPRINVRIFQGPLRISIYRHLVHYGKEFMKFYIGTSGWSYPEWKGELYPHSLKTQDQLAFASRKLSSIEVNNTFYRLLRPAIFKQWYQEIPDNFFMSIKGGKFITHSLRLQDCETALANFFASGVLALKEKLGPILWQLPPNLEYSESVLTFLNLLPNSFQKAALLATKHDEKVTEPLLSSSFEGPLRHTLEFRHPAFLNTELVAESKRLGIALTMPENGDDGIQVNEITGSFLYFRCHAPANLYPQGYDSKDLKWIVTRAQTLAEQAGISDIFIYFDNQNKTTAPRCAIAAIKLARNN